MHGLDSRFSSNAKAADGISWQGHFRRCVCQDLQLHGLPIMNSKKANLAVARRGEKICPVCGSPSYSLGGIHPQCAMQQADAPRQKRLKEQKQAGVKRKSKAKGRWRSAWNKKRCPKCGVEAHVRKRLCACGHDFLGA